MSVKLVSTEEVWKHVEARQETHYVFMVPHFERNALQLMAEVEETWFWGSRSSLFEVIFSGLGFSIFMFPRSEVKEQDLQGMAKRFKTHVFWDSEDALKALREREEAMRR